MSYNISDNSPRQERCNRPARDISFNHETGAITEHGIAPDSCHCHGDADLEELKRKYQALIEAAIKAREAADAAKDEFVSKANMLDTLATGAEIDSTKLALQGSDTTATNTALKIALSEIKTLVGAATDARTAETLFGKIAAVIYAVGNIDFSAIAKESTITTIQGLIGSSTDATTASTLFGKIAAVVAAVGNIDFSTLAKDATVAKEAQATLNKREVMGASNAQATNTQGLFLPAIKVYDAITDRTILYSTRVEIEGVETDVTMLMPYISNNAGMYKGTLSVGMILTADDFNAAIEEAQGDSAIIPLLRLCSNASGIEYAGGAVFTAMETIPVVPGRKYQIKEIAHKTFFEGTENEISMDIYVYEELSEGRNIKDVYDKVCNVEDAVKNINVDSESADNLAQFFGITAATQYTALTDAEVIACCRDEQYNVMGDEWPIPAWLPDGLTEQDIQTAATALGITYHAPTETPSES